MAVCVCVCAVDVATGLWPLSLAILCECVSVCARERECV